MMINYCVDTDNNETLACIERAVALNRESKKTCNDALSMARGRIQSLTNSIKLRDAKIKELEAKIESLESQGDVDGGWIPCSEELPKCWDVVLIQFNDDRIHPRVGYLAIGGEQWYIYTEPNAIPVEAKDLEVVAWRKLPKRYVKVNETSAKFESGDCVLCTSKHGCKLNAIYLSEDDKQYWILDKNCEVPQHLYKNSWNLVKYPGYIKVGDWLVGRTKLKED